MSATPIAASTRYFLPGTTKVLVLPTIVASTLIPTRLEIDAGTDISEEIAAISGWLISGAMVSTPDLGKRFSAQTPGRLTAAESSLTCYADRAGIDVRDVLQRDLETFVVFMDGGDVAARLMDVFKVTVTSVGKLREIENVGRLDVRFAIVDFAEDLAIPAPAGG